MNWCQHQTGLEASLPPPPPPEESVLGSLAIAKRKDALSFRGLRTCDLEHTTETALRNHIAELSVLRWIALGLARGRGAQNITEEMAQEDGIELESNARPWFRFGEEEVLRTELDTQEFTPLIRMEQPLEREFPNGVDPSSRLSARQIACLRRIANQLRLCIWNARLRLVAYMDEDPAEPDARIEALEQCPVHATSQRVLELARLAITPVAVRFGTYIQPPEVH